MKRLLLVLPILFIVGCGQELNENIETEMAEDTQQVISIVNEAQEDNSTTDDLAESDMDIILNWIDEYVPEHELNETETNLRKNVRPIIENMSDYLEGTKDYDEQKKSD